MEKYIALLRGINVSGQKKIIMSDLKKHFENGGFSNVETYIQSGNVTFSCNLKTVKEIEKKIELLIQSNYGFNVKVIVKTNKDLSETLKLNPFVDMIKNNSEKLYFTFLFQKPGEENISNLSTIVFENEFYKIIDDVVYLYVPKGYGMSKLNNNFIESKLKVDATTRNWKTLIKLIEMSA